ncbi:EAL domain-containing protein [Marinobacterium jannaschii]|uniref:EAL domain-containing protein n=1 Tax=Marinobacterium jannaschii TaxID=64970 RepID=UPI0014716E80|nr:EAL domain-containing protein [Marinobacterium jannaschii]
MRRPLNPDEFFRYSDMIFSAFADSSLGLISIDREMRCLRANNAAKRLLWPDATMSTESCPLLPDEMQVLRPEVKALFEQQKKHHQCHLKLISAHGDLELNLEFAPLLDAQGAVIAVTAVMLDVTPMMVRELELKKFSNAVENSGSAVLITDARGDIEYANGRFSDITGYNREEISGRNPSFLRSEHTHDTVYQELWRTVLGGRKWRGMLQNKRKNGSIYWALQSISPIHDSNGRIVNIVSVSEDITHLKEHQQQMEQLAFFDPLTNLGNRRNFKQELERVLKAPPKGVSALLLMDLDHFKQINDTLGHDAGDILLQTVASRLKFCTDKSSQVFRLGGDEFTLMLQGYDSVADIERQTQEILELQAQPIRIGPQELMVTVSIGVAIIHVDGQSVSHLLRNADLAMYHSKQKGRNQYALFRQEMNHKARQALVMENNLRQALQQDQFYLVYQPQLDANNGHIRKLEALIRWHHPEEGMIAPDKFIGKAEESGMIIPIGKWVLQEACRAAKRIQDLGLPPLKVAVNLSTRQLDSDLLLETITQALDDAGLQPRWLELEITEGALMKNIEHANKILIELKRMGISLAIDDFGTGYSSLSYLQKMPFDLLKIDRSFLHQVPDNKDNMTITSTIIVMARQLGLEVVAEGVETPAQLQFLQESGCQQVQGFLFEAPKKLDVLLASYRDCQHYCQICYHSRYCELPLRNNRLNLSSPCCS